MSDHRGHTHHLVGAHLAHAAQLDIMRQRLDGELIVLDGMCFQVTYDGVVRRPSGLMRTPFAVVCRFAAHVDEQTPEFYSLADLSAEIDRIASAHERDIGPVPILANRTPSQDSRWG